MLICTISQENQGYFAFSMLVVLAGIEIRLNRKRRDKRKAKHETFWFVACESYSAERIVWVQHCKYKPQLNK